MFTKRKLLLIPVILIPLVLALCLVHPVFADDGSPADGTTPTEVITTVDEGIAPTEEAPVPTDPIPTDAAADAVVEPAQDAAPAEEPVASDAAVEEPADSEPVRTSGEITIPNDPYFTIGSIIYSYASVNAALSAMESLGVPPTDRTLYVEPGTYNEYVVVDGTANGVKGLTGIDLRQHVYP
jgi:hypothetical protein